jgi:putative ABC transport system permease protein
MLVIIALGFSMAIMISIPAGVVANQDATQSLSATYNNAISSYQEQINQTLTLIECSLSSGFTPGGSPRSSFMPGGMFGGEQDYMYENVTDAILSIPGVKDVVPILEVTEGHNETVSRFDRTFTILRPDYTIVGVPLNSSLIDNYSILPTNITAGRNLQEGDTGVVVLSQNNTGYFGVGLGEEANILGKDFDVVGIQGASSSSDFTNMRNLYMNITDAQTLTNLQGEISRFDVYVNSTEYADTVQSEIASMYPDGVLTSANTLATLSTNTYADRLSRLQNMTSMYDTTLNTVELTLTQTQNTATDEIIIAVVATSLIVLFVMLYTVRERTKEIGTLKAIGFSNWNVMSQFVLEGTLLSLTAGVVGIAIGIVGAPFLSGILVPFNINLFGLNQSGGRGSFGFGFASENPGTPSVSVATATAVPTPQLMLLALGAAALLGALGSLYPAWRASRTRPAEAMRYE